MNIYIDCDDILLNWIEGFKKSLSNKGIETTSDLPETWSLSTWLNLPEKECVELIAEFNASEDFGKLKAFEDAKNAIPILADYNSLHVLTSCSDDPEVVKRREDNLFNEFGDQFDFVTCLPLGVSKLEALEKLEPGLWIEDNFKNAVLGVRAGHRSYCMRKTHNSLEQVTGATGFVRWIDSWDDILERYA